MRVMENFENVAQCDSCGCSVEYNDSDINYGVYGIGYLVCPKCGSHIELPQICMDIKSDNIEYSKHFYSCSYNKIADNVAISRDVKRILKEMDDATVDDVINEAGIIPAKLCNSNGVFTIGYLDDDGKNILVCKSYEDCYISYKDETESE